MAGTLRRSPIIGADSTDGESTGRGRGGSASLARIVALLCMAAATCVAFAAAPAGAAQFHRSEGDFGSAQQPSFLEPLSLAVDHSSGDLLVVDAGRNEVQELVVEATAGRYKLKFGGYETAALAYNADGTAVQSALRSLPSVGSQNMTLQGVGRASEPFRITFVKGLGSQDVEQIAVVEVSEEPLSGGTGASVSTAVQGVSGGIKRFNADGTPADFSDLGTNVIDARKGSGGKECAEEPSSCDVPTPPAGEGFSFSRSVGNTFPPNEVQIAVDNSGGVTDGDIYVTQGWKKLVDVFAADGRYLGQLTASKEGPNAEGPGTKAFGEAIGVTVDSSGNVYVGDFSNVIHKFTPSANPPTVADSVANFSFVAGVTGASRPANLAVGAGPTAGSLFVTTLNQGVSKISSTTGSFEGQIDAGPDTTVAVDPASGRLDVGTKSSGEVKEYDASGSSPSLLSTTPVSSSLQGLAVAAGGSFYVSRAVDPHVEAFGPPLIVPAVATEAATEVAGLSAILHGTINPEGGPAATCAFQFTSAGNFAAEGFDGAHTAACEPAGPFTGATSQAVQAHLTGLNPGAEYRFRLIGTNENGTAAAPQVLSFSLATGPYMPGSPLGSCPNEAFRTGPGLQLPDCRAYEQSTAVDKNGGGPGGRANFVRAAASGDGITFFSQAGLPGGRGAPVFPSFLARRGASAWSTQGILPPQTYGSASSFPLGYSRDLRYVVSQASIPGNGAGFETGLFVEDTLTDAITTIVPYLPVSGLQQEFALVGISADGSRIFFESVLPVTGQTPPGQQELYVWNRASGAVSLAGVIPSGGPPTGGAFGGPYDWFYGNLTSGGALVSYYVAEANAASSDGNQVYFTAGGTGQLFLRIGFAAGVPHTVKVNESQKTNGSGPDGTDPNGPQPAIFAEATADGSRAFFLSSEELTNDANTGSADQGTDLYRYEPRGGIPVLTDLTPDPGDPNGAEVQGVLGSSRDGSVVYFAANGVLAPGAAPGNCDDTVGGGTPRTCNLYRYDDTSGSPQITFVATLNGTEGFIGLRSNDVSDWSPVSEPNSRAGLEEQDRTARVSADGQVLLFTSVRSLTGYRNVANGCAGTGPTRCKELFRYSAGTNRIDCISCDPTGAPPVPQVNLLEVLFTAKINSPFNDGSHRSAIRTRNLSADGNRVFFQTKNALLPADTNGAQDVYEWEANGAGSCHSAAQNGGCLYLISTGQSSEPSYFADADESGSNVFFFTESQLVPADRDAIFDIYDARELGGLASQHQLAPAACGGEACQGAATPAPGAATPGSSALEGPGNVKPKKHRRHHRRHSRHHHRHGKNHRHEKQHRHGKKSRGKKASQAKKQRTANSSNGGAK